MTDDLADATVQCEEWTKGVCTPGSEADRVCRNPECVLPYVIPLIMAPYKAES